MERLGRNLFFILTLALVFGSGGNFAKARSDFLLGPESFPFCGGWVEVWVQLETGGRPRTRLFIKASPPEDGSWKIWNAQLGVEHPSKPDYPLRFVGERMLEVPGGSNVEFWEIDLERMNPFKGLRVLVRPFQGCRTHQAPRGVFLGFVE